MLKLLRINLGIRKSSEIIINDETERKFLGGRGIGAYLLFNEQKAGVDPLSPENKLIFMTSALMGTDVPCCPKVCVLTKSPLTNTILMSFAGGHFGAKLRSTAYDGLILEGQLAKPTYIHIHEDQVFYHDAEHLAGKDTVETQECVKQELVGYKVYTAAIGSAAEKGVKYSGILFDLHTAGRGGAGTVMASKNLKALAVSGSRAPKIADPVLLKEAISEMHKSIKDSPKRERFSMYGTPGVAILTNARGLLPTRNFSLPGIIDYIDEINADAREKYVKKSSTCYRCPLACLKICRVDEGPFAGAVTEGPEYETLCTFGSLCENRDFAAIIAADELCDKYGIDTISAGNCIAFAMELFDRGIIDTTDTDGIELRFGDSIAMIQMLHKIGKREGRLGYILGEGTRKAAEMIGKGSEDYSMQLKGMEWPAYDPRGAKAMALTYATSPRGACHERGNVRRETFGAPPPVNNLITEGKAKMCIDAQNHTVAEDSLGFCCLAFGNGNMQLPSAAKACAAAWGTPFTMEDLNKACRRVFALERMFNLSEGFTRKDDILPKRFLTEPHQYGPAKGSVVEMDELLDQYYEERGWSMEGVPLPETLEHLGLEGFVREYDPNNCAGKKPACGTII